MPSLWYVLDLAAVDDAPKRPVRLTLASARAGPVRQWVARRERAVDLGVEPTTHGDGTFHDVLLQLAVALLEHDEIVRQRGCACHRTGGYPAVGVQKLLGGSAMICGVRPAQRPVLAGCVLLVAACGLASCGSSPAPRAAPTTTTTGSTTTTTSPSTTTSPQGVGVPDVLGMKIDLARFYLKTAGFATVPLNAPCNKHTLPSQSVVASLSIPGRPPNVTVGAQPLVPGTPLPRGARVGITWSGCYPAGTTVPPVTGHTFASAVHLLHLAGLNWACYSATTTTTTTTHPTTTTTTRPVTTTTGGPTSTTTTTTAPPAASTTAARAATILSQGTNAGTVVQAGATITLVMHHCPQ